MAEIMISIITAAVLTE